MTTTDELKPCPFCGTAVDEHFNPEYSIVYFLCDGCGAVTSFRGHEKRDASVALWNWRTDPCAQSYVTSPSPCF